MEAKPLKPVLNGELTYSLQAYGMMSKPKNGFVNISNRVMFATKFNNPPAIDKIGTSTLRIPTHYDSVQTFEYLGFMKEEAAELHRAYVRQGLNNHCDFIGMAKAAIYGMPCNASWDKCMSSLGINEATKNIVFHRVVQAPYVSGSVRHLVFQLVEERWSQLFQLEEHLQGGLEVIQDQLAGFFCV